tara:strand:- start:378 stop:956 length:579 start_codon:yes stop_codon:yes gene_type:complete
LSRVAHWDSFRAAAVSVLWRLFCFDVWLYGCIFIKSFKKMIRLLKRKKLIEFYDSIEEMPHRNYMKFNKEMMRQNEVGNDETDVLKRIERAMSFINAGSSDKAFKELSNARMSYTYANAELHPRGLALASMVKTIDGQPQNDLTSDGLREVLVVLQDEGITKKEVETISEQIKKKWSENLKYFFRINLKGKI